MEDLNRGTRKRSKRERGTTSARQNLHVDQNFLFCATIVFQLFFVFFFFLRYRDNNPLFENFVRPCKHRKKTLFRCEKVTVAQIQENRKLLLKNSKLTDQNIFLQTYKPIFIDQKTIQIQKANHLSQKQRVLAANIR